MMTRIKEIEYVRKIFPRAVGKRSESGYQVYDKPGTGGWLLGVGRTKREAWKAAWLYARMTNWT